MSGTPLTDTGPPRPARDGWIVFAAALAARLAVVAWAAARFPPTADGTYYHRIAARIAAGLGSTWAWPDGAVTYAAHYPVGYPATVAAVYTLAGPHPAGAMALNALAGAVAALAVHRLAARAGSRRLAALAGALVAVHPGLVAYTPALMTEGITASLLACAAWAAAWARDRCAISRSALPFALVGAVLGVATLVRPQTLPLAPMLAWLAASGAGRPRRSVAAVIALAAALAVCAPWTARNCVRMGRCALVSVNAGWNLLIGADPEARGGWAPVKVPAACSEVFDEAEKDVCFEREARRLIADRPGAWIALVPSKLAATFDYCGAAGWYLHASNPEAFSERHKLALGAVETLYERLVLLLCIAWAGLRPAVFFRWRILAVVRLTIMVAGALSALHVHAWIGHVALLVLAVLQGGALFRGPLLASSAIAVLAATALAHAVFFGSGRYGLVTFPLLTGLAALGLSAARRPPGSPGVWGRSAACRAKPPSVDEVSDFDTAARPAAS